MEINENKSQDHNKVNKGTTTPESIINWFRDMGFEDVVIDFAFQQAGGRNTMACQCGGDANQMIQEIMYIIEDINPDEILNQPPNKEKYKWDPIKELKQLERKEENPFVGLQNNANICYFNSILQAYFQNPKFVKEILIFNPTSFLEEIEEIKKNSIEEEDLYKSLNSSVNMSEEQKSREQKKKYVRMVLKLQYILVQMTIANIDTINPYDLTLMFYNDCGNKIDIGEQKDISEFLNYFFTNIAKGIETVSKPSNMGEDSFETSSNQQNSFIRDSQENNEEVMTNEDYLINVEPNMIIKEDQTENQLKFEKSKSKQDQIIIPPLISKESQSNAESIMRTKSQNIKDTNPLTSLIYSKRAVYKVYKNPITNEIYEQKFSEILEEQSVITLKQGNQELYDAWDKYMTEENKEFKYNFQGVEKPCYLEKKYFFPVEPEQLVFIIDRVKWSSLANQGFKTNGTFKFDKTIYIDRFMKKNKENIEGQKGIKEKKEDLLKLEESLQALEQFDKENSLSFQISKMQEFISLQIKYNNNIINNNNIGIKQEQQQYQDNSKSQIDNKEQQQQQSEIEIEEQQVNPTKISSSNPNDNNNQDDNQILNQNETQQQQQINQNQKQQRNQFQEFQQNLENSQSLRFEYKNVQNLQNSFEVLQNLKIQSEARIQEIQQQIVAKKQEIDVFYTEYKNHKFHLQSIFMHEGGAQAGHYYCYIYNFYQQKWMKFSDKEVQEVKECKVLEEAIGGDGKNVSAYALIYIPEQQANDLANKDLFQTYRGYISPEIKAKVERECQKVKSEFLKKQNEQKVDEIMKLDNRRFNLINKWVKNNQSRYEQYNDQQIKNIPVLQNFSTYLFDKIQSGEFDIVRWFILETSFRDRYGFSMMDMEYEVHPGENMSEQELELNDQRKDFIMKMRKKWLKTNIIYWDKPNNLALKQIQYTKLMQTYVKNYNRWIISGKIHASLYNSILKKDFREGFNISSYLDKLQKKDSNSMPIIFKLDLKPVLIILGLKYIEELVQEYKQQNNDSSNSYKLEIEKDNIEKIQLEEENQDKQELSESDKNLQKLQEKIKYHAKLCLGYVGKFSNEDDVEQKMLLHSQQWLGDIIQEAQGLEQISECLSDYYQILVQASVNNNNNSDQDDNENSDQEQNKQQQQWYENNPILIQKMHSQHHEIYEPMKEEILGKDCLDWNDDEDEDYMTVQLCDLYIQIKQEYKQVLKLSRKMLEFKQPFSKQDRDSILQQQQTQ